MKQSGNVMVSGGMANTIALTSIPKLTKNQLQTLWKELFQHDPPLRLRRDIMVPILCFRLQEQASEGINAETKRKLFALARALVTNPNADLAQSKSIKPGTRLVRQWGNKVHVVDVEQNGYKYNDFRYESLSQIARIITGTRWSGPLFFGIKARHVVDDKEVA
jgi:hypothetical protein